MINRFIPGGCPGVSTVDKLKLDFAMGAGVGCGGATSIEFQEALVS